MAIGKKEIYYTLTDVDDTSKVYKFNYCRCHAEGNGSGGYNFYCDGLGDDILPYLYSIYYQGTGFNKEFYFNGLVGCKLRFMAEGGQSGSRVHLYIAGEEHTGEKNWQTYCDIEGQKSGASTPNPVFIRCGLMLGYLDNNLYTEGVSIIPFHVPATFKNGIVTRVYDFSFPYQQITTNSAGVHAGSGYVGNIWHNTNIYPTRYLLKDYHTLSFSDSGDIKKQQPLVAEGFPYGDGESTSQGGQGDMEDTSEPIEIESKPLLTTGEFLKVYKMTATNLSALRDKLISTDFLDKLITKLRTNAMDYIIGLTAIPFASTSVAEGTIKVGNLDTGINAQYLTWYIEDLDCGEIELTEYFQTFMDYSPHTKISVYLPFCGIIPLNVDQFMNDKIKLKYRIDLLTGQCVVFISNSNGIVTTASGSCAYMLPLRSNDYTRVVATGLGMVGAIAGTAGALALGNIPLAIGAGIGAVGGLTATAQAMGKPEIISNGSVGGNFGLLGNRTPYLIIQRPTISVPKDYGKTLGYMSRISAKLGDLTGYTKVEEIHLEHINATSEEKTMIENLLKEGVIL